MAYKIKSQSSLPKVVLAVNTAGDIPYQFMQYFTQLSHHPLVNGKHAITSCSLLPHARNANIRGVFKHHPDFTHVLLIDSDMSNFHACHLDGMIARNEDIVSGICVLKIPPYPVAARFREGKGLELVDNELRKKSSSERNLIEVEAVGSAFILLTKEVLLNTAEITKDGPIWFSCDRRPRVTFQDEAADKITEFIDDFHSQDFHSKDDMHQWIILNLMKLINFGINSTVGSDLIGEDIDFCWRAKTKNYKVYIDPNVIIDHIGQRPYNFADTTQHIIKHLAHNCQWKPHCLRTLDQLL